MLDPNVLLPIGSLDTPEARELADPSAQNELMEMESRYAVRQMLDALSSADAEVLHLLYWRDLTLREAGKVLGISDVAVMKRRDKAVSAMRKLSS